MICSNPRAPGRPVNIVVHFSARAVSSLLSAAWPTRLAATMCTGPLAGGDAGEEVAESAERFALLGDGVRTVRLQGRSTELRMRQSQQGTGAVRSLPTVTLLSPMLPKST